MTEVHGPGALATEFYTWQECELCDLKFCGEAYIPDGSSKVHSMCTDGQGRVICDDCAEQ